MRKLPLTGIFNGEVTITGYTRGWKDYYITVESSYQYPATSWIGRRTLYEQLPDLTGYVSSWITRDINHTRIYYCNNSFNLDSSANSI